MTEEVERQRHLRLVQIAGPSSNHQGVFRPGWLSQAGCRDLTAVEQKWFFDDEEPHGELEFTENVYSAMKICHDCPVRRECLTQAFEQEWHIDNENAVKPRWVEDHGRHGVWGGVPGQIREAFSGRKDRLEACEAWFLKTAIAMRFGLQEVIAAKWKEQEDASGTANVRGA